MSKNPVGRPTKARIDARNAERAQRREDNWRNVLTGLGSVTHDKRTGNAIGLNEVGIDEARILWRSDDIAARVVEMPAKEVVRPGFVVSCSDDSGHAKAITENVGDKLRALGFAQAIARALMFRRAMGGGAILLGADDGQGEDWSKPLVLERVRSFDFVSVFDAREIRPLYVYADPLKANFGETQMYEIWPATVGQSAEGMPVTAVTRKVHASRVIAFSGPRVARDQANATGTAWGDSIFTRIKHVLSDFATAWASCGVLFNDFAQPVFKMQGLGEAFANDKGGLVLERMKALALAASTVRMIMIDAEEEYARHQTPIAGFADLLDRYSARMAAAAEMPLSMLMGESPGGLNASGASGDQLRMFYDRIAQIQENECSPAVERAALIAMRALKLEEPEAWSVKWNPLHRPSAKDDADTRGVIAAADRTYIELGVLTPDEVRVARFGGDTYSMETQIDHGLDADADRDMPEDTDEMIAGGALEVGAKPAPGGAQPSAGPQPSAGAEPAKAAMTGVQVTSLIEVVTSVATGKIARESGAAILKLAFPLDDQGANDLLGPEGFKPTPEEPKIVSMPPGAGGKPPFPPKPAGARAANPFPPKPDAGEAPE